MCLRDIRDLKLWKADANNLYAGQWHPILGTENLGNPYRVSVYGRTEAICLFNEHHIGTLTDESLYRLRCARNIRCFCRLTEACHVELLLKL